MAQQSLCSDLLHHPRPASRRAKMSLSDRSAQFSPFAALSGFEAAIAETGRLTQPQAELTDSAKADIDWALQDIRSRFPQPSAVMLTYFIPDRQKKGGCYRQICGNLISMDSLAHTLTMEDGLVIGVEQVYRLELTRQAFA